MSKDRMHFIVGDGENMALIKYDMEKRKLKGFSCPSFKSNRGGEKAGSC